MNQDPDRPIEPWEQPHPAPEPPPAPEVLSYPPSAGPLTAAYPTPDPYPVEPYRPDPFQAGPAAPQYFPHPVPMNMVHQFPPAPQIVVKRSFPHGLHLILTLITCGLWSPIWLIHYLLADTD